MFHKTWVPVALDPDTGDIWRSPETGFAKRSPYNEGGEIIVQMPSEEVWPGYWNSKEATNKKLVRDVFKKGDLYYRTGDALRRTDDGMWYFMDRLGMYLIHCLNSPSLTHSQGDTYRWKGENVSTTEVSEILGNFPGVSEANVYGVTLPNHDGRAGCAAISVSTTPFDWKALAAYAREKLPKYAVPPFIRLTNNAMNTHNNKQNKVQLRQEGVDLKLLGTKVANGEKDELFWLRPDGVEYVPFRQSDYNALAGGKVRL